MSRSRSKSKKRYIVSVIEITEPVPELTSTPQEQGTAKQVEIYSQNVKSLDLTEVIKAVNK